MWLGQFTIRLQNPIIGVSDILSTVSILSNGLVQVSIKTIELRNLPVIIGLLCDQ